MGQLIKIDKCSRYDIIVNELILSNKLYLK